MNGCPCEPNGTDGLQCPDKDGRLLCQTSPSRARPSALPYALEKLEEIESSARQCAGAGSIGGLNVASLQAAMLRLADQVRIIANEVSKEIHATPESRAGDCDFYCIEGEEIQGDSITDVVVDALDSETAHVGDTITVQGWKIQQTLSVEIVDDDGEYRLTTKATP